MPDLKTDAEDARGHAAFLAMRGFDPASILRLADMADRLADTEGLVSVIAGNSFVDYPATHAAPDYDRAAQAVQDYVRGE